MNVRAREPTWRAMSREAPLAEVERREPLFSGGFCGGCEEAI
jgi:hypothetical protein